MIHTEVEIAATPERVREVFLDFAAVPTWHTGFITSIARASAGKTSVEKGDGIRGVMGGVTFDAVIQESSPHMLSWTGPPFYHLFRGLHIFRFEASTRTAGGTTFMQEESFTGVMSFMMRPGMPGGKVTKGYFDGFNADLKRRVESLGERSGEMDAQ